MWRVQGIPHPVFEFLPRYGGFQVLLKGAEVEGGPVAQCSGELNLDVTGGGERHGQEQRTERSTRSRLGDLCRARSDQFRFTWAK